MYIWFFLKPNMFESNTVVIIVIAANVLFSMQGFNDFSFFEKFKFNIAAIKRGEQVRMLSSGFLHADWIHLGFNMYTLYIFAPIVVNFIGNLKFVLIYVASLLFGNLLSYFFHKNEPHYSAIGASGAVSGILYTSILLNPKMDLYFLFINKPIPAYIFGIGYLLYSIYGMKSQRDNIGHDAHFGGAVAGYVLTIAFVPEMIQTNQLMVALLAIPIVLLFVLIKTEKI